MEKGLESSRKEIEQLKTWIAESDNIVFFGGAGVSTESNIPDFRSEDGLYRQEYAYPPEVILSHTFYRRNPEEFFRFYRAKMIYPKSRAQPGSRGFGRFGETGKTEVRDYTKYRRTGTRRQAAGRSGNCMVRSFAITVKTAGKRMMCLLS